MFQPIEDDTDQHEPAANDSNDPDSGAIDLLSLLGISADQLPDEIDLEKFQQVLLQQIMQSKGRQRLAKYNTIEDVVDLISSCNKILVLTGAGISVSAGIPDFRSENGLYKQLKDRFNLDDPTAMFDQNHFLENPSLFYSFGGDICPGFDGDAIQYYPTPTHYFIKSLESNGKLLRNYTQNIDTLEVRAGIENVITCHGSYRTASCTNCEWQIHGAEIQRHIFDQKVPFCPYCCPQKSDLKGLIENDANGTNANILRAPKPVRSESPCGKLLYFRIPKILCSMRHLFKSCPVIFSVDCKIALLVDGEVNMDMNSNANDDYDDEKNEDEGNKNFKVLTIFSESKETLLICNDAIMHWLQSLPSWGAMKPDIVFFGEVRLQI